MLKDYDYSFSNCWDGEWPATEIANEIAERQMKIAGTNDCARQMLFPSLGCWYRGTPLRISRKRKKNE
jgi:hypothetical protein